MEEKIYSEVLAGAPFLRETVVKFLSTLPARIVDMEAALARGAQEDLRAMAHRLKGTGGTHGYPSLSDRARTLESAIKQNDMELVKSLLVDLKHMIASLVPEPPPK
jgi:HPt (histidine-containing phosphotransfer) domain-containing protein